MRLSFQLKIALISFGCTAVVFAAFAGLLLNASRQAGLARMQRQMRLASERVSHLAFKNAGTALKPAACAELNARFPDPPFPFVLTNRRGELLYVSTNCPPALATALAASARFPGIPPDGFDPDSPRDRDGREDFRSGMPPPRFEGHIPFRILNIPGSDWYTLTLHRGRDLTFISACNLKDYAREMRTFLAAVLGAGLLGLLILAAAAWWLAGLALRPVQALTAVASRITSRDLHERVRISGASTEFAALIDVINSMLERLDRSFQQAQRFSADAAHELKTPLAILQGMADQAIRHAAPDSPEQRFSSDVLDEVQRLKSIVYKLLLLSQSDAGKLPVALEPVSLTEQAQLLCDDLPLLAPGTPVNVSIAPSVIVRADSSLLRQALQNLFSNAAKYNRPGGAIACELKAANGEAVLELSNGIVSGSGLNPARLFERFYRGDPSHNRAIEGSGLGLSLAREIMRAMGGTLEASLPAPDRITFRLTCPLQR